MRFEMIMNMPTKRGDLIHRLVVEHPANSVVEFVNELTEFDFVIVEEFFPDEVTKAYKSHGLAAINRRYVAKVKKWER
jgi:hypothetical protein